ncbi:hypothetical protein SteCoe_19074 [Stentor coeruleus]|uniref:RING-type domain-containing protein n=1 Tax=Stentor coeruleus TaxID=5963 RepID=A0A1R2BV47_9CILI|nr:hypothetical protein SteCoe_19074 [Stentor coeruleus]
MINASHMFEIREERVEDDGNSTINITNDRLTTEYFDDEDYGSHKDIDEKFGYFIQYLATALLCFIALQIYIVLEKGHILSIFPLAALEIKNILYVLATIKIKKLPVTISSLQTLIMPFGILISLILIFISLYTHALSLMFSSFPLFLTSGLDLFFRLPRNNAFEKLYIITLSYIRLLTILLLFFIGLKLDNYITLNLMIVLWPLWVFLVSLCILSFATFMICLCSIYSYMHNNLLIGDLMCAIWGFLAAFGATVSGSVFVLNFLQNKISLLCIEVIVYLIVILIITFALRSQILRFLKFFFPVHRGDASWISNSQFPLPIPASQASHMIFNNSKKKSTNLPPRALMRISSSYFQPASTDLKKRPEPTVSRALSHDFKDLTSVSKNKRSFSLAHKPDEDSQTVPSTESYTDKKCVICVEGPCDSVFMDCGHGGICFSCANTMVKNKETCHFCRAPIIRALKIKVHHSKVIDVIGTSG